MDDKDNEIFADGVSDLDWGDFENDFDDICCLMSTEKRDEFIRENTVNNNPPDTIAKANEIAVRKLKSSLSEEKWTEVNKNCALQCFEGHHLRDFVYFFYFDDKDETIEDDSDLPKVSHSSLKTHLKNNGLSDIKSIQNAAITSSASQELFVSIFKASAEANRVSLPQCFLGFLQFCVQNHRPIRGYEPHDIKDIANGLKKHIGITSKKRLDEKRNQKNRVQLIYSGNGWLNPYFSNGIPFIGRIEERRRLDEFLNRIDNFKIWCLEAPSGAGKTRLIIHWLNTSTSLSNWEIRWLHIHEKTNINGWDTWSPQKPTIIILDYMFGFEQCLKNIILNCRKDHGHKIRLFVLNHIFDNPLWEDKRWGLTLSQRNREEGIMLFHKKYPLRFSNEDEQGALLATIIATKSGLVENDNTVVDGLAYLQRTKGAFHPLFAALLGDAIRNNESFNKWDRRELVRYYLSKERLPWEEFDNDGYLAASLVCVGTALNGPQLIHIIEKSKSSTSQLPDDFDNAVSICNAVTSSSSINTIEPLSPDLLGESFFIKWLAKVRKLPSFQDFFFSIFELGPEENQKLESLAFQTFITRVAANLIFDDSTLVKTQAEFDDLLFFVNPSNFTPHSYMRLACSLSLFDIYKLLQPYNHQSLSFRIMSLIEVEELYRVSNLDEWHIKHATFACLYFLDFNVKNKKISPKLPPKALTLFSAFESYQKKKKSEELNTIFFLACQENLLSAVNMFIEENHKVVNCPTINNYTPLMLASQCGSTDLTKLLIKCGANIHHKTRRDATAIMIAASHGNFQIVKILRENGASILDIDDEEASVLHWACKSGRLEIVKYLIEEGANVNVLTIKNATPLMIAAQEGSVEIVMELLPKTKNLEQADTVKDTALNIACRRGHAEVVAALLNSGAAIAKNCVKRDTLIQACISNHSETIKMIVNEMRAQKIPLSNGAEALSFAVSDNNYEIVELFLSNNVSVIDFYNSTSNPLICAAAENRIEVLNLFLPQIKQIHQKHLTEAVIQAVEFKALESVKFFIDIGLDIREGHWKTNYTTLMAAAHSDSIENLRFLLRFDDVAKDKAFINAVDHLGRTALIIAGIQGNLDLFKELISHGADYNYKTSEGITLLFLAIFYDHIDIVKHLLTYNDIEINCEVADGESALSWACYSGKEAIIDALIEDSRTDINFITANNKSAIRSARMGNNDDIALKIIANRHFNINQKIENDMTLFLVACKQGEDLTLDALLSHQRLNVNQFDKQSGYTGLMMACENGHLKVVKRLLEEKRIDSKYQNSYGTNAIALADEKGHLEIVEFLLRHNEFWLFKIIRRSVQFLRR